MEEMKKAGIEFINTALAKFKGLTDQKVIGNCICTLFITGSITYLGSTLIKNGGIKYGKSSIGNVQNQALLENK